MLPSLGVAFSSVSDVGVTTAGCGAPSPAPEVVRDEVDHAVELIRSESMAVSASLRDNGGDEHLDRVATEIEQLSQQLGSVLADVPAEVGDVVDAEIADLRRVLRPPGDSMASASPQLVGLPEFNRSDAPNTEDEPHGPYGDADRSTVEFVTEADFNRAAKTPAPNTTYRYRDVEWTTDELGRTISVIGRPSLERATRDARLQAEIGREGRPTDVGFHLLGHALGGPTNRVNVVSGNGFRIDDGLANLNQGAYAVMERSVRSALAAAQDVHIEIRPVYHPRNLSRRPEEFHVRVVIEGEPEDFMFINK